MNLPTLRERLAGLDEVRKWPAMMALVDRLETPLLPIWDCSRIACEACGGQSEAAEPAAAAILSLSASIALADDILDGDPSGPIDSLGFGRAANMTLALQAAAAQILETADFSPDQFLAAFRWLHFAALATARGQDLDTEPCSDEETYWRVMEAKSTPLLQAAMALGAISASFEPTRVGGLARIGHSLGKIIQINDDLTDAMSVPPTMDWRRPRNNLALLFASIGEHENQARFLALIDIIVGVEWPESTKALEEAQLILTRCGGLGYSVYQIVLLYKEASKEVSGLGLPRGDILQDYLDQHVNPVVGLLEEAGLEAPLDHMRS